MFACIHPNTTVCSIQADGLQNAAVTSETDHDYGVFLSMCNRNISTRNVAIFEKINLNRFFLG